MDSLARDPSRIPCGRWTAELNNLRHHTSAMATRARRRIRRPGNGGGRKRLSSLPGRQQAQQPHGQLREIALRGNLGRACRCRAEALVSGRARDVPRAPALFRRSWRVLKGAGEARAGRRVRLDRHRKDVAMCRDGVRRPCAGRCLADARSPRSPSRMPGGPWLPGTASGRVPGAGTGDGPRSGQTVRPGSRTGAHSAPLANTYTNMYSA